MFKTDGVKKIIQVKKGEYLLEIRENSVATTYNMDVAMDISNWSLGQLGYIIGNLKRVGYTKCKVLEIEKISEVTEMAEEVKEEKGETKNE